MENLPIKENTECRHYNGKNEFCYYEAPRICDKSDWENCPWFEAVKGEEDGRDKAASEQY